MNLYGSIPSQNLASSILGRPLVILLVSGLALANDNKAF
jgi:hypothetical protein